MSMWTRKKEQPQPSQPEETSVKAGTTDFEDAVANTTAQASAIPAQEPQLNGAPTNGAPVDGEKLFIPEVVAAGFSRALFWPGQRWIHPDMRLTDEEAKEISPQAKVAIQFAADKILPAFLVRIANSASPVWDFLAVVVVLYAKKYEAIQQEEAARVDNAKRVEGKRVDEPASASEPDTVRDDLPLPGKPYSN